MNILGTLRQINMALHYGTDLNFEKFMVAHGDCYNLCTDFDEDGHPTKAGIKKAERFIAHAKNWTPVAWWLYGLWEKAKVAGKIVICELVDHDYIDDSYGGPESGCMAGHCARCGWSFHHTLY